MGLIFYKYNLNMPYAIKILTDFIDVWRVLCEGLIAYMDGDLCTIEKVLRAEVKGIEDHLYILNLCWYHYFLR